MEDHSRQQYYCAIIVGFKQHLQLSGFQVTNIFFCFFKYKFESLHTHTHTHIYISISLSIITSFHIFQFTLILVFFKSNLCYFSVSLIGEVSYSLEGGSETRNKRLEQAT
jgi:hypothetical protein